MKKFLLIILASLLLSGYEWSHKLDTADYGYSTTGTLYIKKIDAISEIYEKVVGRHDVVAYCLQVRYDGQTMEFCGRKYFNDRRAIGGAEYNGWDGWDDKYNPRADNLNDLLRMKKKFHQIAGDDSIWDRTKELLPGLKAIEQSGKSNPDMLPLCPRSDDPNEGLPDPDESEESAKKRIKKEEAIREANKGKCRYPELPDVDD